MEHTKTQTRKRLSSVAPGREHIWYGDSGTSQRTLSFFPGEEPYLSCHGYSLIRVGAIVTDLLSRLAMVS